MKMKERLYLTEDRGTVVSETDRRGRHLLCKKGSVLDNAIAKGYGLVNGRLPHSEEADEEPIIPPEVTRAMRKIAQEEIAKSTKKKRGRR